MSKWVMRWGYEAQATSSPGVMRLKDGGWLLFAKVEGRIKTRIMREGSIRDAQGARASLIASVKASTPSATQRFDSYAAGLFLRKLEQREIKSQATSERWKQTLEGHLYPAFGSSAVDAIDKLAIETWKTNVARRINAGELSPHTANGWLSILLGVLRSAVDDLELPKDPTLRVRQFGTDEHETYTDEDPNSLTPKQCPAFVGEMRRLFPQFYALTRLGFATGLRPSTLRPLRRSGPVVDVHWDESAISVRRSNSRAQVVMNTTKTGVSYKIGLSEGVMAALLEHEASLTGKRAASELLFPSKRGGFMSRSALDKPFAAVSQAIGLGFDLTPRGMRRTFQDLCRAAGVEKEIRKAICGHETDEMSEHYATHRVDELRAGVALVDAIIVRAA